MAGTRLFAGEPLPEPDDFDLLVVMGGPMSVGDEAVFDWLVPEKRCIARAIAAGKTVLGICLGAQLLAESLGGTVYRGDYREIGWFPVRMTPEAAAIPECGVFPAEFTAFHWHGDTFTLPPGCVRLAESGVCGNQAFVYDRRVFGVQFHVEVTDAGVRELIACCPDDLRAGPFVQDAGGILSGERYFTAIESMTRGFMDRLSDAVNSR